MFYRIEESDTGRPAIWKAVESTSDVVDAVEVPKSLLKYYDGDLKLIAMYLVEDKGDSTSLDFIECDGTRMPVAIVTFFKDKEGTHTLNSYKVYREVRVDFYATELAS